MRVVSGEETVIVHRSFSMKKYNYRHCPLKKRPVQMIKEYDIKIEKGKIYYFLYYFLYLFILK